MPKISTKKIVRVALLIAIEIVLSRFLSIATPIVKIGFGFLPIALIGMLYGPFWAGGAAALADFLGAMLFPIGAFFPGFTLTAFLTGFTYGALLREKNDWWRIITAVAMISLLFNLGLDTLWIYMISGKGYMAILPTRVLKCIIMAPVQVVLIRFLSQRVHIITAGKEQ